MPIYTCTTVDSALTADVKATLAGEISRIHSEINHVPSTYVNVVFPGLPADSVYTDGVPASPLLISGWVRSGHPEADTTRLATEIAAAATRVTGIPADRVLVVLQSRPAHFAVEGGRVLPAPGDERVWMEAVAEERERAKSRGEMRRVARRHARSREGWATRSG